MAAERVDYYSDDEYLQAVWAAEEELEYWASREEGRRREAEQSEDATISEETNG